MATRFDTVKRAVQLAIEHRKAIANGNFAPFLPALAMAITKDSLLDVVAAVPIAGLVGTFLGLFITVYLFIFLFGKGKWKVRIVILILGFFDAIPVIGVIPFSTVCVLYAYKQARAQADQSERELKILESQIGIEQIRARQMTQVMQMQAVEQAQREEQAANDERYEQEAGNERVGRRGEAANDPAYQQKKVRLVV